MGVLTAKKEIGLNTVLQRKGDILFNQIDGEVVMLSIENSEYYGMDKVGSRIWELLEKPLSFNALLSRLTEEFEVSEEQCTLETHAFVDKLKEKELITFD